MKKILAVAMSVLLAVGVFSLPVKAQQNAVSVLVRQDGIYYAAGYSQWQAVVSTGTTATGAATLSMLYGYVTLPDGRAFVPFSTTVPLQVDVGANAEVVTPSSVSGCFPLNPNQGVCQVTATFANVHGNGTIVSSGDLGMGEAILDAGNNGGGQVYWSVDTGNVTLNLAGLTTTTSVKVPSVFYSMGASARVEVTITGSTAWLVGISGTTNAFCTSNATLTAGTTCQSNLGAPALVGTGAITLTAILITATVANATAGVVRVHAWGYTPVQSLV